VREGPDSDEPESSLRNSWQRATRGILLYHLPQEVGDVVAAGVLLVVDVLA
jgi:hypothetical protein